MLKPRVLLFGAASLIPGASWVHSKFWIRPNIAPAEDSYGIWLKHLSQAMTQGGLDFPGSVVELGPGLSAGVGLAALISGAQSYTAMDVQPFIERAKMLEVFDELVRLFRSRQSPNNADGFPSYEKLLDESGFPSSVLNKDQLDRSLEPQRLAGLREQVAAFARNDPESAHPSIRYLAPWSTNDIRLKPESCDMVMAHGVLQHIDDVKSTVDAIQRWLRPGGVTTQHMDLSSLNTSSLWNGHWACPDWQWRLAVGRKDFLANRLPASRYVEVFEKSGLSVAAMTRFEDHSGYPRQVLKEPWRQMSEADATTRGSFMVACKR